MLKALTFPEYFAHLLQNYYTSCIIDLLVSSPKSKTGSFHPTQEKVYAIEKAIMQNPPRRSIYQSTPKRIASSTPKTQTLTLPNNLITYYPLFFTAHNTFT